jgi:hypothetical protein
VITSDKSPIKNLPVRQEPLPEARATSSQIGVTAIVLTAIVTIFLWGLNHQRTEAGSQQTAASQPAPTPAAPQSEGQQAAPPPGDQSGKTNPPSTTGSGNSGSPPQQQQNSTQ